MQCARTMCNDVFPFVRPLLFVNGKQNGIAVFSFHDASTLGLHALRFRANRHSESTVKGSHL